MTINYLNLIVDCRLESSFAPEKTYFQPDRVYPLPKSYEDCVLPAEHPWFNLAKEALSELESAFKHRNIAEEFEFLGGHAYPNCIITRDNLPFVIKIHLDNENCNPNTEIKRALIASRVKKFVKENELENSIYVPDKFLMRRPLEGHVPGVFTYRHYAVLAEKVKLAKNDLRVKFGSKGAMKYLSKKRLKNPSKAEEIESRFPDVVWKQLSPERQLRQKMHCVYTIAMLGLADMHDGNVCLLEDGRFCLLDLNEPYEDTDFLFTALLSAHKSKGCYKEVRIRPYEIKIAKKGLFKFLKDPFTRIKYDEFNNNTIYDTYITMLSKELLKNKIHRTCVELLATNCQEEFPGKNHFNFTETDTQQLLALRKENLEQRAFFVRFHPRES